MQATEDEVVRGYGVGVRFFAKGLVARMDVGGPLTEGAIDLMRFYVPATLASMGAQAFVMDMRRALIVATTASLDAYFDGIDLTSAVAIPAALVVSGQMVEIFRAHCWNVAQRGFTRAVFTDLDPAHEWAARKAAVRAKSLQLVGQARLPRFPAGS